jgi:hypothetical protein
MQLFTDPGFENGLTGWTVASTNGSDDAFFADAASSIAGWTRVTILLDSNFRHLWRGFDSGIDPRTLFQVS